MSPEGLSAALSPAGRIWAEYSSTFFTLDIPGVPPGPCIQGPTTATTAEPVAGRNIPFSVEGTLARLTWS